jgi:hypothetical protein
MIILLLVLIVAFILWYSGTSKRDENNEALEKIMRNK